MIPFVEKTPEGEVLKNLVGAKNAEQLREFEHPKVGQRVVELRLGEGPQATYDLSHLQSLHRHLFQDVYEWAGHLRSEVFTFADGTQASMPTMQKSGGAGFARGPQIENGLNAVFASVKKQDYFRGLDRPEFARRIATAFATVNSIHAFREGNGRTQREFFAALAAHAGHPVDFSVVSSERMAIASIESHDKGNLEPMIRMFEEISDPARVQELSLAQEAVETFAPRDVPHIPKWDDFYMAIAEPGQSYTGTMIHASDDNFLMLTTIGESDTILVGRARDLPSPAPEMDDDFSFTASPRGQAPTAEASATNEAEAAGIRVIENRHGAADSAQQLRDAQRAASEYTTTYGESLSR